MISLIVLNGGLVPDPQPYERAASILLGVMFGLAVIGVFAIAYFGISTVCN